MAAPHRSGAISLARPGTRQASSLRSRVESSAARCCVFRGHKFKNAKLTAAQTQPASTQACSTVNFLYAARSPTAGVSTSATTSARQAASATQMYGRPTASNIYYVERKIKLISSKADSYNRDLESEVRLFNTKMSSYVFNLNRKIQLLNENKNSHTEIIKEIQRLNIEQDSYAQDTDLKIKQLRDLHTDVVREIEHQNARKDSFAEVCGTTISFWAANVNAHELDRRMKEIAVVTDDHNGSTDEKIKELTAKKDAYAQNLDSQIKLLTAKKLQGDDLNRQIWQLSARKDCS